ncbi:MAG: ActS/PrrB/RegB family redox-sensitive histidine kinase [Pseudomonadota bacterium]
MATAAAVHHAALSAAATPRPQVGPGPTRATRLRGESNLRLVTFTRLRWIACAGQLATVVFVHEVLGFTFPIAVCLTLIFLSALFNILLRVRFPSRKQLTPEFGATQIAFDISILTGLLMLTGGVLNPFVFLLIAPVTMASAILPARLTLMIGVFAALCAVVVTHWHLPLPWYAGQSFDLPAHYRYGILASVICGAAFIGFYANRLSTETKLMTDALAAAEHVLAREHRLQSLDGLAAAAAHELGTPLSTITVVAKEIELGLEADSPILNDVRVLREQSLRCRQILNTLTRRSGEDDPLYTSLSVSQLIDEVLQPHRRAEAEITVNAKPYRHAAGPALREPICERNPARIYGLANIIDNAVDFANTQVDIVARWDDRRVQIVISDDGSGFDSNIMERLGEPFVTSRSAIEPTAVDGEPAGLGLGFFIAKTLLERTGAELDLANKPTPHHGAVVGITWERDDFEARMLSSPD